MTDYRNKAAEYLERLGPQKAAIALVHDAKRDGSLAEHLLVLGAQQMIRNAVTSGRSPPSEESARVYVLPSEAGRNARLAFMDTYRLYGGEITLAAATPRDLAESARQHDAQAAGHNRSAAFERDIGKRIHNGKTVRDVFKDSVVRDIAKAHKL